jgi:hypothetical protein
MELRTLVRDVAALQEGRWVDQSELPALGDLRIRARGSHTKFVRDALAEKQRSGSDIGAAFQAVVEGYCILEIDGLTNGGKPISLEDLRPLLADDPEGRLDPLRGLFLDAVARVDATREAKEVALEKN